MTIKKVTFQKILDYADEAILRAAKGSDILSAFNGENFDLPLKLLGNWKSALANGTVHSEVDMTFHQLFDLIGYVIKIPYLKSSELETLDEYILSTFSKPVRSEGGFEFTLDPNLVVLMDPLLPHQRRVVDEDVELVDRIGKLEIFNKGPIFSTVDLAEQVRLTNQLTIMKQLHNVLAERIEAFTK